MPNDIPLYLLEKALALTGKIIEDVSEVDGIGEDGNGIWNFSIEKFCYYLLSPEFIEKYLELDHLFTYDEYVYFIEMAEAIYEYQKGNPDPLISLLSKI